MQPKEMDLNMTISIGSADIPLELLGKIEEFLQKHCISGLCSIEHGSSLSRLHLQMVCRMLASSVAIVSKKIKEHLQWDDPEKAPVEHYILTKALCNIGLHTFIGMLGYCIKDKGKEHFDCVHRNISNAQLKEGVEEYIKHDTPFAKNRVTVLTHTNLIERATTYCKSKMRKQLGSTLLETLLPILQYGQYISSASWVLLICQGGIEFCGVTSLWKYIMNLQDLKTGDVTQIFFEHTNPGSCLANLEQQWLAGDLKKAREGSAHEYDILDDVLVAIDWDANNVIVLDSS